MSENKYILNHGLITQKVKGEVTIFAADDSILFTLNETGAYIFQCLKLNFPVKKIALGLEDKYDITRAQAEADIKAFIELLLKKKIFLKK